jgi:glycosyltransferase involved in cell wall biosynthesis
VEIAIVTDLISVIVSTYNRPDALDTVLRSLARQSDGNFEVLVADDGSRPDTAAVVKKWQGRVGRRVVHVWHPDDGFRLAEIRNRAIVAAQGAYCVFLDGDCLTRADFIAAHRALAARGWFVTGNRVLLSRALTARVLRENLTAECWTMAQWLKSRFSHGINRLAPLVALPLGPLRKARPRAWRGARGANIAMWRSDLIAVDGFDSVFAGWGREDSDLFVRLIRAGVRRKDGRYATGVLHLWHPDADRARLSDNEQRLAEVLASDRIVATKGLSALRVGITSPTAVR